MSIQPYTSKNQTSLVPNSLLGYSSNGVSAIEILPTSITIAGDLTTTPIYVGISATTGLTTTNPTGLDVNCDFNMNSNDITNLDTLSSTTGSNLTLSSSDNAVINSTGIQLLASDFITMTANNDNMTLTADDDITLTSIAMGVKINGGNGDGGNNDIVLTSNSGTLSGSINLNSANTISLLSANFIDLNAQNSTITLNALTDITLQTNGQGSFTLNAPTMNSYGNALPICLNQFESGTWSYTLGGQVFEDVFAGSPITIALPPQFFAESPPSGYTSTRWQINFDMNCWNFTNAGDKGFAIYLSFLDSNSNLYEPFLYNNQTPYCKWDNPPTFNGAFTQFKSINFCDYIDFSGLVGSNDSNIRLQMNIAGDNQFLNVDFKFKLGFTRIQRV